LFCVQIFKNTPARNNSKPTVREPMDNSNYYTKPATDYMKCIICKGTNNHMKFGGNWRNIHKIFDVYRHFGFQNLVELIIKINDKLSTNLGSSKI